ncbi:hypothetical protein [Leptodesmis sichuanensis]|uniref:hypothetical protein n=1 Tax=Leptodesmis sichuanensis TaxID=2906798 RepID=UPI001F3B67D1|nr:hypothetical protein [Leptodesmis sichuanensis]UIE40093.1 hypothetical protein KIK02_11430 [Leptodesmis sichuanensis A121]
MSSNYRLILYHKHPSSGRTLFLRLHETVCQFDGLSTASRVVESHVGGNQVNDNLSDLLTDAEHRLGMANGTLTIDREFNAVIDDADTPIQIYLARFTTIDPPQEHLAEHAGKFIALTEARRLLPTELELLRLAYSIIMDD